MAYLRSPRSFLFWFPLTVFFINRLPCTLPPLTTTTTTTISSSTSFSVPPTPAPFSGRDDVDAADCLSALPLPAAGYHDLARVAHCLSATVSSDLADILKDFANSLELLSFAQAIVVASQTPITVLLPPWPAIRNWESIPLQVQEHVIVGVFPLQHLRTLHSETEFQTLLPGRCLKLTGSTIRQQLFSCSHVVVHFLTDEIVAYDCDCASGGGTGNINIYMIVGIGVGVIGWKVFHKWKRLP